MRYRVFQIPEPITGRKIAYVPGEWKLFLVPAEAQVPEYVEVDHPRVSGPRILPDECFLGVQFTINQLCNLACVYCYADARPRGSNTGPFNVIGRGPQEITWPVAKAAVDRVINDARRYQQPKIEIMYAGGEPTLSFGVLEPLTRYVRTMSASAGLRANIGIVSNGLFGPKIRDWLIASMDYVSISIDGQREAHNRQRPSISGKDVYDQIISNLDALHHAPRLTLGLRMTITAFNVKGFSEDLLALSRRYPGRRIGFEPVQDCGRCSLATGQAASNPMVPRDEDLRQSILKALACARQHSIRLKSSLLGFKSPDSNMSFCGVDGQNFSVDPAGNLSACTRVTSEHDPFSPIFQFGKFDPISKTFVLDRSRYQRLKSMHIRNYSACQDCFAQFNCKGDCAHVRAGASDRPFEGAGPRCGFVRKLTLGIFQQELGIQP